MRTALRGTQESFLPLDIDDTNGVVRGVVFVGDAAQPATVALDRHAQQARVLVQLGVSREPTRTDLAAWLGLGSRPQCSRIAWDHEEGVVWLDARSLFNGRPGSSDVLRRLIVDVQNTLADEGISGMIAETMQEGGLR